ncbi:Ham1-like protein [Lentinula edodes]|uniref:Inosine triphosphate pyrophosphatase n=1 Tax=Lentinula edodes TaxID=5353 RepID=A0A1Q3EPX2_LENED|nr:Ham1-like protein [Lentinula edodes]
MSKLVFVTGNANKLKEVQAILSAGNQPVEIDSKSLDIDEIQGSTQEVSRAKCKRAAELLDGPCITEDTALCFEALDGLPGPYIKYFLEKLGHDGINKMLVGFESKKAWALSSEPILFEGRTDGTIVPARGAAKFGWDPVFEPNGTGLTYAEMASEQKNLISHRFKALEKLRFTPCGNTVAVSKAEVEYDNSFREGARAWFTVFRLFMAKVALYVFL